MRMFTFEPAGLPHAFVGRGTLVTPEAFKARKLARQHMVENGVCPACLICVEVAPFEIVSKTVPEVGLVFSLLVDKALTRTDTVPINFENSDLAYIVEKRMERSSRDLLPSL